MLRMFTIINALCNISWVCGLLRWYGYFLPWLYHNSNLINSTLLSLNMTICEEFIMLSIISFNALFLSLNGYTSLGVQLKDKL